MRLALITTVLSAIAIAVVSLYPVPQVPLPGSDKTRHFVAYAVLALPLSMVRPLYAPLTFLVVSFYGGVIELMQPAAGRMWESADLVANAAGAAAGSLLGVGLSFLTTWLARRRAPF